MFVGDVKQVFGSAAFVETELITYGLLNDDIVCLLRSQNFIDVLCRSHTIHLISLKKDKLKTVKIIIVK